MLENLNNLVREEAQETIVKNPAIPNEKNEEAIQAASGSIEEVLQEKASTGNFGDLSQLFKGGDFANNPIVNKIKEVFAGKLGNMGIDGNAAGGAAAGIIPALIEKFVRRTNDPNDKGFDLQNMLKQFAGPDGKFDMNDVMGMFGKKDDGQQTSGKPGGLGGSIGGFFK
jgi:hypothetical protein